MEFTTLAAMLAAQAADGLKVTVRDTRQSYIYLKNRPDLVIDNVNVFETPVSSDRWVAEKAIPTWDEAAIVSALGYAPEDAAQKGEANGYAELDASSRIPLAQLPTSVQTLKGSWNASTNTPTLADGSGTAGDTYRVSVAATRNLGSGNLIFGVDDRVVYNGTTWEKWDTNDAVTSVHGRTGDVTAQAGDYSAHYAPIGNGNPAGTVIQFAGTSAPTGYLACDGASLLRTSYADLFAAIGTTHGAADGTHFNVPDMRGLFVRGAGAHGTMTKAAGGAFGGGSVGATENDKMQGHNHDMVNGSGGTGGSVAYGAFAGVNNYDTISTIAKNVQSPTTNGANGTPRTGNETKPASISLLYCIKT